MATKGTTRKRAQNRNAVKTAASTNDAKMTDSSPQGGVPSVKGSATPTSKGAGTPTRRRSNTNNKPKAKPTLRRKAPTLKEQNNKLVRDLKVANDAARYYEDQMISNANKLIELKKFVNEYKQQNVSIFNYGTRKKILSKILNFDFTS